jgi:hypothetical protein
MEFLSSLPQPSRDNPWLEDLTNNNFKTRFHYQRNYLIVFQMSKKINDSVVEKEGQEIILM